MFQLPGSPQYGGLAALVLPSETLFLRKKDFVKIFWLTNVSSQLIQSVVTVLHLQLFYRWDGHGPKSLGGSGRKKEPAINPRIFMMENGPTGTPKTHRSVAAGAAECVLCAAGNNSDCTGNYTLLGKKHLCKGNSFPFPPPAWPRASAAFKTC